MLMIPPLAIAALQDKNIVVLGVGLTGLSCVRFLRTCNISCAVNDSREAPVNSEKFTEEFPDCSLVLGYWHKVLIANADIILVSPGIDLAQSGINDMIQPNTDLWGDIELFCFINAFMDTPLPILAVTGSNGKSTVVAMLAHVGNALGVNTALGGNIGQPVLDLFTVTTDCQQQVASPCLASKTPEMLVLELSSFQLETITRLQSLAASVLNISDDHLDRHLTLDNYQAIKQRIYQQANIAIVNRDDIRTQRATKDVSGQTVISFGSDKPAKGQFGLGSFLENHLSTSSPSTSDLSADSVSTGDVTPNSTQKKMQLMFGEQALVALNDLPLAGIHNALNYLAVLALGHSAAWSISAMVEKLKGFTGLAHRCQVIATTDGIQWINDSKATNVGATLAAINGLAKTLSSNSQLILIAGGDGKGADFTPLTMALTDNVSHLITLGKDGDEIAALVPANTINCWQVTTLEQAVEQATQLANVGDTVLLSPACSSLDMFKNFAVRGERFMAALLSQPKPKKQAKAGKASQSGKKMSEVHHDQH